ncbi:hypothetical protein JXC34_07470 [Candidatus Woesearchaeota archaeon]|nr:hypothetical protein [Candidatus Woesearchaeota archaeon]
MFEKDYRKNNFLLGLSIFLAFFVRLSAYVIIPFFSFAMIFYFVVAKKDWRDYCIRYSIIFLLGISLYSLLAFGNNIQYMVREFSFFFFSSYEIKLFFSSIGDMTTMFFLFYRAITRLFFIFAEKVLVILVYLSLVYYLLKKKDSFWIFLFFQSQIIIWLFLGLSFPNGLQYRYMVPVHFTFLIIIFESAIIFLKQFTSSYTKIIFLLVFSLFTFNLIILFQAGDDDFAKLTPIHVAKITEYVNSNIFLELPVGSRIFVSSSSNCNYYDYCGLFDEASERGYLAEIDSRFRYIMVNNPEESDYILYSDCSMISDKYSELMSVHDVSSLTDYHVSKLYLART